MADQVEKVSFPDGLSIAQEEVSERFSVTEVSSVWAPIVTPDSRFAQLVAEELAEKIKASGVEMTDDELNRLVQFGATVGSLSLRQLFMPFVSDEIWVDYREDSGLDQTDALRRLQKGVRHPHGNGVISTSELTN